MGLATKSAKRKLKKLSGNVRRFKKDINHVISKSIISKAKGTARAIGFENLKHIRSTLDVAREVDIQSGHLENSGILLHTKQNVKVCH